MKIAATIVFYVLFTIGAVRLFKVLTQLWPILFGQMEAQPLEQPVGKSYYRFEASEPMELAQIIIRIITGLLAVFVAFYIRKKSESAQPNT